MATARPIRARRATGVPGDEPPPLNLGLRQRLFTLALANIVPLIAVAVIAIGVAQGKWTLKASAGNGLMPLLMILGACLALVTSWWIVLPIGRWLRDRPRWHFRHGSRLVWALPYAVGWCAWLGFWIAGVAAGLGALALLGMSLVRLAQVWLG